MRGLSPWIAFGVYTLVVVTWVARLWQVPYPSRARRVTVAAGVLLGLGAAAGGLEAHRLGTQLDIARFNAEQRIIDGAQAYQRLATQYHNAEVLIAKQKHLLTACEQKR